MKINNFVLIIGAMKCGTTSLFNYLAEHPEISACSQKEPAFFSKITNYSLGIDHYKNLWDWDSTQHKIALEASTGYTRVSHPNFLNAAENIAKYKDQADFKFIYIMRNPFDRIEAHYNHGIACNFKECQEINDAQINREILETSKYSMQLDEYYSRFSSNSIFLINFDNLKANPQELLKKLCLFLEINPEYNFQGLSIVHNSKKKRTIVNLPMWSSLKKNQLFLLASQTIPLQYKNKFRNLIAKQVDENFQLSAKQKRMITKEVQKDLKRLKEQYNFDISC
jgi:hypothetical protein